MKRFQRFIREDTCKCPDGWEVFAALDSYCICIERQPSGSIEDDDNGDGDDQDDVDESVIRTANLSRDLEFPLMELEDLVRVRLSRGGMFLKVGSSNYFPVPEAEVDSIWDVIGDRLRR